MEKFEKLFAEYPCSLTDELVKKNASDILAQHKEEIWDKIKFKE